MIENRYYLIAPIAGDHIQVNERYAPNMTGVSENFTAADIAKLCKVRKGTAENLISQWIWDGVCKEVL